ncbi:uncharacterized protein Z519_09393 [Cladophialophora bantiana CBS 173.52]|uniref:Uncharacterized protein n=1 Tax=Cladophialophora bantiana (strain ATCC 10958 / CBS 173.52 / CDC B-1940 / NIH 8579) TaxID=1442370 RepID=A0A0D2H9R0_CLAB1|nr:uncharacterized protein Z519_09393 [Cladophialophora bantiana CBS 173.52]KIW89963.1 hypothetical protein Z519_09393 [Cladophialophora bantiana CBS 173.52]
MASASPLRTVDTNTCSPPRVRPVLSTRTSINSRASSIPTTPLDGIPGELWPRILRTSAAAETSNPELSVDEITSTRLSLDDQAILANTPREGSRKEALSRKLVIRMAFGGMWGENSDRLKRMTKRLKNIPNGLFTRKRSLETLPTPTTLSQPLPEPTLPQLELTTELCVQTTGTSSNTEDFDESKSNTPVMDYECKIKVSGSCPGEMAKISSFIREDLHEATNKDRTLPPLCSGNPKRLPRHFRMAPVYGHAASTSTVNSIPIAEDRLLRVPRPLKVSSRQTVTRASSVGSVDEMRSRAFGSRRVSRPSLSSGSARHSYTPSISRTSLSASRPATHAGSISSSSTTIAPPRRPVVYMDTPISRSDYIFNGYDSRKRPSGASTARPVSKGASIRSSQDSHANLSLNLPPEVEIGLGDIPGYKKVPLYTPRRFEVAELSGSSQQDEAVEQKQRFFPHSGPKNSSPTISDISFGSLRGQTSIQSHLEREAMVREQKSESETPPAMGGCEKLSRALCGAWSESTTRLWQKGCKRHGL